MKKLYLALSGALLCLNALAQISLTPVSTYHTGIFDEGAAEIVAYDEGSQQLFFSNANDNSVGILDFNDPTNLTEVTTISLSSYGDGVNSVSTYNGVVAVAVEIDDSPGKVVFFDDAGTFLSSVTVGYLPDMVTFSHDGNLVVVACEGEPSDDWVLDPAGSVAIIDVSGGVSSVSQNDVILTEIGSYTGSMEGVRIFGPDSVSAFKEDFQDTTMALNQFTTFNELSSGEWYYDSYQDDFFAEGNGYGDDTASIDWLISSLIDLGDFEQAFVSFQSAKSFSGGSLDFLISADYDGLGDPTMATWDTLTAQAVWSTGGYVDTNSGDIDISAYNGNDVAIAFLYRSSGNGGGDGALWQIDDIHVKGVHSVASNLEPEYVAVSKDNSTAYVNLQENNAIAVVDLATGAITDMMPLGYKDHSVSGNGLDASDDDGAINITTYPFRGLYLPDAIAVIEIDGVEYILTANEGDARDYDAYSEEERLADVVLDPTAFPDAATLQNDANGGRINITTSMGDIDQDGDFDEIYTFGARSFTIWTTDGDVVYDSGDEFEQKTAELFPDDFNSSNDDNDDFDSRSDAKGPEPEAIEVATIGDKHFAFIGLERMGGVFMYDITDPANASYVTYVNNRDFGVSDVTSEDAGDLGVEDIVFIDSAQSADGHFYIVTSNEVSGTVTAFRIDGLLGREVPASAAKWTVFPNPADQYLQISQRGDYSLVDLSGRLVKEVQQSTGIDVSDLNPGMYLLRDDAGAVRSFVKR